MSETRKSKGGWNVVVITVIAVAMIYGTLSYFLPSVYLKEGTYSLICAVGATQSTPEVRFETGGFVDGHWVLKTQIATASYTPRQGELCIAAPTPSR